MHDKNSLAATGGYNPSFRTSRNTPDRSPLTLCVRGEGVQQAPSFNLPHFDSAVLRAR